MRKPRDSTTDAARLRVEEIATAQLDTVADRLRWVARKLGLTQNEFAASAGISPQLLSRWVNNPDHPPTEKSLERIAKRTGLSLPWLRYGTGEPIEGAELVHGRPIKPELPYSIHVRRVEKGPGYRDPIEWLESDEARASVQGHIDAIVRALAAMVFPMSYVTLGIEGNLEGSLDALDVLAKLTQLKQSHGRAFTAGEITAVDGAIAALSSISRRLMERFPTDEAILDGVRGIAKRSDLGGEPSPEIQLITPGTGEIVRVQRVGGEWVCSCPRFAESGRVCMHTIPLSLAAPALREQSSADFSEQQREDTREP